METDKYRCQALTIYTVGGRGYSIITCVSVSMGTSIHWYDFLPKYTLTSERSQSTGYRQELGVIVAMGTGQY